MAAVSVFIIILGACAFASGIFRFVDKLEESR